MQRIVFGPRDRTTGPTLVNLAAVIDGQGKQEEAFPLKVEARDVLVETMGADHPGVAVAHNNVGASLHDFGRHDEALAAFEEALRVRRVALGSGHPLTVNAMIRTGQCLADLRRYTQAETLLLEAQRELEPGRQDDPDEWNALIEQLARVADARGRGAEARRWLSMKLEL